MTDGGSAGTAGAGFRTDSPESHMPAMTPVPQPPAEQRGDVAAWLDRLEKLKATATPEARFEVVHVAVPQLVAAIRGVLALADQIDRARFSTAAAIRTADRFRSALAAALTDGTPR